MQRYPSVRILQQYDLILTLIPLYLVIPFLDSFKHSSVLFVTKILRNIVQTVVKHPIKPTRTYVGTDIGAVPQQKFVISLTKIFWALSYISIVPEWNQNFKNAYHSTRSLRHWVTHEMYTNNICSSKSQLQWRTL